MAVNSPLVISTFYKQSAMPSSGLAMTCWSQTSSGSGSSHESTTCDLGGSTSSYNNIIAVRFFGLTSSMRVKNAKATFTFGSYDYKASMTYYCQGCGAITSSNNGTSMPTKYGSAVSSTFPASSTTATTNDISSAINSALANGSNCVYFYTTAGVNNRKTNCSKISLSFEYATASVTFYRNQTSSDTTTKVVSYTANGNSQTFPDPGWTYTGHHFDSWNTAQDGSGTKWTNLTTAVTGNWILNNNEKKVYMQWDTNKVQLVYHPNGGTVGSSKYTVVDGGIKYNDSYYFDTMLYGESDDLFDASTFELTRTGYYFGGWYRKGDPSKIFDETTQYASTNFYSKDNSSKTTANTELVTCYLYAYWIPNQLILMYDLDNGVQGPRASKDDGCSTILKYGETFQPYYFSNFDAIKPGCEVPSGSHWRDKNGNIYNCNDTYSVNTIASNAGYDLGTTASVTMKFFANWDAKAIVSYDFNGHPQGTGNPNLFYPLQEATRTWDGVERNGVSTWRSGKSQITFYGTMEADTETGGAKIYGLTPVEVGESADYCITIFNQGGAFYPNDDSTTMNGQIIFQIWALNLQNKYAEKSLSLSKIMESEKYTVKWDLQNVPKGQYFISVSYYGSDNAAGSVLDNIILRIKVEEGTQSTDYFYSALDYSKSNSPTLSEPSTITNVKNHLGYNYTGWNREPDKSGIHYNNGWAFTDNSVLYGDAKTLYLEWEPKGLGHIDEHYYRPYIYKNGQWNLAESYVYNDGWKCSKKEE